MKEKHHHLSSNSIDSYYSYNSNLQLLNSHSFKNENNHIVDLDKFIHNYPDNESDALPKNLNVNLKSLHSNNQDMPQQVFCDEFQNSLPDPIPVKNNTDQTEKELHNLQKDTPKQIQNQLPPSNYYPNIYDWNRLQDETFEIHYVQHYNPCLFTPNYYQQNPQALTVMENYNRCDISDNLLEQTNFESNPYFDSCTHHLVNDEFQQQEGIPTQINFSHPNLFNEFTTTLVKNNSNVDELLNVFKNLRFVQNNPNIMNSVIFQEQQDDTFENSIQTTSTTNEINKQQQLNNLPVITEEPTQQIRKIQPIKEKVLMHHPLIKIQQEIPKQSQVKRKQRRKSQQKETAQKTINQSKEKNSDKTELSKSLIKNEETKSMTTKKKQKSTQPKKTSITFEPITKQFIVNKLKEQLNDKDTVGVESLKKGLFKFNRSI